MTLEVRIREACEDHGVSQQKMADYLGMSRPNLSRYWHGNRMRNPNLDVLEKIAKHLGVPALSLFRETPDK